MSMICWRSSPVPANALPSSSTVVASASWSTDCDRRRRCRRAASRSAIGVRVSLVGDLGVVLEVRRRVGLRLQLDVLLADRGAVADHGEGVGRDVVLVVVDLEVDVDAVVGELELADLADLDAAVGDLAAREDAAGLLEVRDDGVVVVDDAAGRAGRSGHRRS